MFKKEKIKIVLVVLISLLFFVIFILTSNIKPKEISPPTDPLGKTYGVSAVYEAKIANEISVYDFMLNLKSEGKINFKDKDYTGMGKLITELNGIKNSGKKNWIYYVNGEKAKIGVSNYKINPGDVVSWKYEKNY